MYPINRYRNVTLEDLSLAVSKLQSIFKETKSLILQKKGLVITKKLISALLTTNDIASQFNLSFQTIYSYEFRSMVPSYKIGGRIYFERKDVEKWVRNENEPKE